MSHTPANHLPDCVCCLVFNSLRPKDAYMRGKLPIIGSDNGLSPDRRQAIIWTNAGLLSIGPLWTYFSQHVIKIKQFSLKKMHVKMSSAKWRPSCLGLNVLTHLVGRPDILEKRQYHDCWCPGSFYCQGISSVVFHEKEYWLSISVKKSLKDINTVLCFLKTIETLKY